jgi:hypothetical protein
MLTEAAVLWEPGGIWEVGPVEFDPHRDRRGRPARRANGGRHP